jgi:hypothetical protein
MLRGHIVCQRDRQAARLLRNKCRDRTAQRPYVRLHPLAYVAGDMSRGSIGPPPERGVGASATWSEHVSAPDPCLALTKAWVFFSLASRGSTESGPDPLLRGSGPILGVWFALVEVLNPARKSGLCIQGSGPFLWGSRPTVATLEYIVFPGHAAALEPSTWWGQVFVRHTTKDSRMDIAPLYCSNGYPFSRVLTVAPGPASGEDTSLQVGPKLDLSIGALLLCACWRNYCQPAFEHANCHACLRG